MCRETSFRIQDDTERYSPGKRLALGALALVMSDWIAPTSWLVRYTRTHWSRCSSRGIGGLPLRRFFVISRSPPLPTAIDSCVCWMKRDKLGLHTKELNTKHNSDLWLSVILCGSFCVSPMAQLPSLTYLSIDLGASEKRGKRNIF